MIRMGSKVRDVVTGLEGIVTARCEYLTGCVQFCVVPRSTDGKMPDGSYIDEQRLERIEGGALELENVAAGGPQRDTPPASYRG